MVEIIAGKPIKSELRTIEKLPEPEEPTEQKEEKEKQRKFEAEKKAKKAERERLKKEKELAAAEAAQIKEFEDAAREANKAAGAAFWGDDAGQTRSTTPSRSKSRTRADKKNVICFYSISIQLC